ncbi:hypothetical protein ACUXKH_000075 [Staphylococcus epidermidis]|uniref:hypothetical protein n=1 Tax=Staphylococcus lugdunensis TaxID=28035 RepID=UPI000A171FBD|nr:hypothetical protein [Staphylococcus lugdunensis]ARJ30145.1 hypothetical protein B6N84_09120 [Staphylococcus lugdunensis]MCH8655652.1 hypothetical protein [Staphylococcus lugdunensis]
MTKNLKPIQSIYLELVHEYFKSNQKCDLGLSRTFDDELIIEFLHYHDHYKTNNKLIQIFESKPESHKRLKNLVIEVMRGQRKIKKGA